jgi:hypothetical protein
LACWFFWLKKYSLDSLKLVLDKYHCACSLKARGKTKKLKKQTYLQKPLRVHDLQGELTPEIYFACWFSWSKNYNLNSLKLV